MPENICTPAGNLMTNIYHSKRVFTLDLGVPTELESYQHQCLMLVDELHEAWSEIRRLEADARTLITMNDVLKAELNAVRTSGNASLNRE